jgi:hypothetical protein
MFHEEDLSAWACGRIRQALSATACIDAHDAPWNYIGKGKKIVVAKPGIQKCSSSEGSKRPGPSW